MSLHWSLKYSAFQKSSHPFGWPERKPISSDHLSWDHWTVPGLVWANSFAECPSVVLGHAGQKEVDVLSGCRDFAWTHRMCSQGKRATPWISNRFGFQGAFHLCQDKLVLLIPTSFIMASHPTGNGTLKHVLGKVSQLSGSKLWTGENTAPSPARTTVFSDSHQESTKAETSFQTHKQENH